MAAKADAAAPATSARPAEEYEPLEGSYHYKQLRTLPVRTFGDVLLFLTADTAAKAVSAVLCQRARLIDTRHPRRLSSSSMSCGCGICRT
jgi:hypothetical protein